MEAGKPLALLTYLALGSTEASRDHLVDLLWANVPVERGRQSLRQALWQLRRRLGQGAVIQSGDRLRLAEPVASDVADFLEAVTEQRAADAERIYAGPFFQPFATPGALEFEHWANATGSRLQAAYVRLSERAAAEAVDEGNLDRAITIARRLRDATPDLQAGWRLLIDIMRIAGRLPAALLEADALEARLALEKHPMEESTARLFAEVRRMPVTVDSPTGRSAWELTELVGREAEFAALLAAWQAATQRHPQVVEIRGEPGLGKTRLLRELRQRLAGAGVVLVGARPEERDTPYAFATDLASELAGRPGGRAISRQSAASLVALDPRLASIYAVDPDLSNDDEGERRRLLALGDLVEAVADERPVALLLDDVHWADPTSARVIVGALRRVNGPVLVVATARPGGASLGAEADATTCLVLEPLDAGAVTALLTGVGSFESDDVTDLVGGRLHLASAGSPLRALDALREATSLGMLHLSDGTWRAHDLQALFRLWDQMRDPAERLRRCPVPDRAVLLALALWARPASAHELGALTTLDRATLEESCRRLERGGLIAEGQGEWRPYHHTVAELAQAVAPPAEREAMHRRVATGAAPLASDARARRDVVRHLWHGGEVQELRHWVAAWLGNMRTQGDRRPAAILVDELCTPEVPNEERQAIVQGLPWLVRRPVPLRAVAMVAASLLVVLGLVGYRWVSVPVVIAVTTQPLAPSPATPAPVVELRDRLGRRVAGNSGALVLLRGLDGTVVRGDSSARLDNGSAAFNAVSLVTDSGKGASAEILVDGEPMGRLTVPERPEREMHRLRWLALKVNGVAVDPDVDTVRVAPGQVLNLDVAFTYDELCTCAALLTVVRTWERDHSRGWMVLSSAAAPRAGGVVGQSFSVKAAETDGMGYLLFVLGRETAGEFVASQTNWKLGKPRWNDGMDLADVTGADIAAARRDGSLSRRWVGSTSEHEVFQGVESSGVLEKTNWVGAAVMVVQTGTGEVK